MLGTSVGFRLSGLHARDYHSVTTIETSARTPEVHNPSGAGENASTTAGREAGATFPAFPGSSCKIYPSSGFLASGQKERAACCALSYGQEAEKLRKGIRPHD